MKNIIRLFLLIFSVTLVTPYQASAAESSIAVVDVVKIFSVSKAAVSIEKQRDALREKYLGEISSAELALREEEQALLQPDKELSQEEYAEKRSSYEKNLIQTRKLAQEKKRQIEEASAQAMEALRNELNVIVQDIANREGYALVISNKNVIAGEKSLDITDETLKRLNKDFPQIKLKVKDPE